MIPLRKKQNESPLPDLTPMLDTVFILLFFFVIAATFAIHGVDLKLPQSSAARAYSGRPVEILLYPDGSLAHNGEKMTLRDLKFLVQANAAGENGARQILLVPDKNATVGAFMATVSTIRDNGGERLVIAADPATSEGQTKPSVAGDAP